MKVHVNKKVKVIKTTRGRVRAEALVELSLLTRVMTAPQLNNLCKYARDMVYNGWYVR